VSPFFETPLNFIARRFFNSLLGVWKIGQTQSFEFDMFHLTSEEAARAESGNFLLVNPSDDVHSKKKTE